MTIAARQWRESGRHLIGHLLIEESDEIYRAKREQFLSSHALDDFRRNPPLFRKKELGLVPDRERPAYVVGRAAHTLILEGTAAYEERYAVGGPINPKTGNPYGEDTKAFAEWAEAQGKPVLSQSQAVLVEQLAMAVTSHDEAMKLLGEGWAERVVRAEWRATACQARLDWLNPSRGIIDLKTCDNLSFLEADIRAFGYTHQLAFYRSVLAEVTGESMPAFIIGVEKREPYRCGVWVLSDQSLRVAELENMEALLRLKRCRADDIWPSGYESIRTYDAF